MVMVQQGLSIVVLDWFKRVFLLLCNWRRDASRVRGEQAGFIFVATFSETWAGLIFVAMLCETWAGLNFISLSYYDISKYKLYICVQMYNMTRLKGQQISNRFMYNFINCTYVFKCII